MSNYSSHWCLIVSTHFKMFKLCTKMLWVVVFKLLEFDQVVNILQSFEGAFSVLKLSNLFQFVSFGIRLVFVGCTGRSSSSRACWVFDAFVLFWVFQASCIFG